MPFSIHAATILKALCLQTTKIPPMTMNEHSLEIVLAFPPRSLRPEEREILAEWLETPGNLSSAYTNERRCDDPMLYRKVVVTGRKDARPTHLICAPSGVFVWIIQQADTGQLASFSSLRDALNSIWPGASDQKATTPEYDRLRA